MGNPQTLNLYSYVENNPITGTDPDGHGDGDTLPIYLYAGPLPTGKVADFLGKAGAKIGQIWNENALYIGTAIYAAGASGGNSEEVVDDEEMALRQNTMRAAPSETPEAEPTNVYIDPTRHPESAQHAQDAINEGHPDTLTVDRAGASDRRRAATSGASSKPNTDKDEYPFAVTKEGGKGSSVRNISSKDNRGSGGSLGQQIKKVPNGAKIKVHVTPKPTKPPTKPLANTGGQLPVDNSDLPSHDK